MSSETSEKTQQQTVGEMTRADLKALIREVMQEMLWEHEQRYTAEDGLPLKPEFADELRKRRDNPGRIYSAEEVHGG